MMVIEGRAFYRGKLEHLCLGVEDGVIKSIKKTLKGDEHHDFGRRVILPGGVDVHVHFREPGLTHKEDFFTGTQSAAAGGITSVLDMPNTEPPATTVRALREKKELASKKANVDFGLFGGVERRGDLSGLGENSHAYKLYMAESFGRPGIEMGELPHILARLEGDRRLTVHAEDPAAFQDVEERTLVDHMRARPQEAEESAIRRLLVSGNVMVHIAHLSSRAGLASLQGTSITGEVTPMHLLHDAKGPLGSLGKINPPLREPADREALWAAFTKGHIDVLASDHAPHTLEEKEEFLTAPPGAPNVETTYPLMFHLVKKGMLPLPRLVQSLCENPARLFGLGGKGELREGRDADIVVFDPQVVSKVRDDRLHYKCGWSPFEGWEAIFPVATFLRGELVASKGELEVPRSGRWIPHEPASLPSRKETDTGPRV